MGWAKNGMYGNTPQVFCRLEGGDDGARDSVEGGCKQSGSLHAVGSRTTRGCLSPIQHMTAEKTKATDSAGRQTGRVGGTQTSRQMVACLPAAGGISKSGSWAHGPPGVDCATALGYFLNR